MWSLPELVIVHLKRFSQNRYGRDKLDVLVDFPVDDDLDLSSFVKGPSTPENGIYRLYAVDNHFGGLGGGHCMYLLQEKSHYAHKFHRYCLRQEPDRFQMV